MGQVGALIEINQRWTIETKAVKNQRRLVGDELKAYACFIDFKKAYDMVPHEALLYKLRAYGICGKTYNFIRTLYDRSSLSVRVGHLRSPKVPFERKEVYVKAVHYLPYCSRSSLTISFLNRRRDCSLGKRRLRD